MYGPAEPASRGLPQSKHMGGGGKKKKVFNPAAAAAKAAAEADSAAAAAAPPASTEPSLSKKALKALKKAGELPSTSAVAAASAPVICAVLREFGDADIELARLARGDVHGCKQALQPF